MAKHRTRKNLKRSARKERHTLTLHCDFACFDPKLTTSNDPQPVPKGGVLRPIAVRAR